MRRPWLVMGLALVLVMLSLPALADTIVLPTPEAARVQQAKLISAVGGRPDRLLASDVPGPVINDEVVKVGVDGGGGVQSVIAEQRLRLTGEGDYAIRERGPARRASSLSADPPPVTRRGAVVWQGFSPGRRDLAARLTLDAQLESTRLPLQVSLSFTPSSGPSQPLGPGGEVPGPGMVRVTITNLTEQPADLPTGSDADPGALASALDRALAVARRPSAARLPATGTGLPKSLSVTGASTIGSVQTVPLRLTGTLTGARFRGPTLAPDGSFAGTLGGSLAGPSRASVTFEADVVAAGRVTLDLTAVAALNAKELTPKGFPSWAAWARSGPSAASRKAALDLLVAVAATGARASSYGPYLGADLIGTGSTTFHYALAPVAAAPRVAQERRPQWWAISLVGLAVLLLLTGAVAVWRRS